MREKLKGRIIPKLPSEIRKALESSENQFVSNAEARIEEFNDFCAQLPKKYGWRFRTVEALKEGVHELANSGGSIASMNSLYWRDMMGNWEAYAIMSSFRLMKLVRSCLWALGRKDIVCACLLARAILENSVTFVDAARTVSATIENGKPFPDPKADFQDTLVSASELEKFSLKVIFATRLPEAEDIYSSVNVLTVLKRISKAPQSEFLYRTYELLSEVVHPNWPARSVHISDAEPGKFAGNELRTISQSDEATPPMIIEQIIAAVSWSVAAQVSSFHLMAKTIALVLTRLSDAEAAEENPNRSA